MRKRPLRHNLVRCNSTVPASSLADKRHFRVNSVCSDRGVGDGCGAAAAAWRLVFLGEHDRDDRLALVARSTKGFELDSS
jgi:hypothetical protein